jgi:hypothetical protein
MSHVVQPLYYNLSKNSDAPKVNFTPLYKVALKEAKTERKSLILVFAYHTEFDRSRLSRLCGDTRGHTEE